MAVAGANLLAAFVNNVSVTTQDTASGSPTANRLQLFTVSSRTAISIDPNIPTVTGAGLTWVAVNNVVWDTTSASRKRMTTFRALGAGATPGALTIDFGLQVQTDIVWTWDEFTGMDTSGTDGSAAIVQSAVNKDETTSATSLTVTLAAFSSANNATFGVFVSDGGNPSGPVAGYSLLGSANGNNKIMSEYRADNDTTVDMTFASGGILGGIACEIKAAGGNNNLPLLGAG